MSERTVADRKPYVRSTSMGFYVERTTWGDVDRIIIIAGPFPTRYRARQWIKEHPDANRLGYPRERAS
jgi:hypothetical protein